MAPKKRNLDAVKTPQSGSRRRSTRLSSTVKKSSYFANEDDVDDSDEDGPPPRKTTKTGANASRSKPRPQTPVSDDEDQYEDEDEDVDEEEDGDSDAFDEDDDSVTPPPPKSSGVKQGRGRPAKGSSVQPQAGKKQAQMPKSASKPSSSAKKGRPSANTKQTSPSANRSKHKTHKSNEDDDEDKVDDNDDDDDDEPMVTLIHLPRLRDTDGVEYEDTKVHPNTFLFLGDLKANNKRSWLKLHDPEYRRSLKDWESFVETLTQKIIEADETIPELPLKDVIFRIYRDIRFSKDQTPYKPHYSAAWSRTGRKGPYACYYVHIEPGHCLVGGGLWQPEASALAKLRASVDERPHRIRRVLTDPEFVRNFLPNAVGKKEDKILKAFADKNQENALKTKPKGFNPDHRDIQLLKLRNYTAGCQIPDEDLRGDDAQGKIMNIIRAMVPFITFLNNVVMPDPDVDSDSDEEENGDEQGEDDVDEEDEEDDEDDE